MGASFISQPNLYHQYQNKHSNTHPFNVYQQSHQLSNKLLSVIPAQDELLVSTARIKRPF